MCVGVGLKRVKKGGVKESSGETKGDTQKQAKMSCFYGDNSFFLEKKKRKQKKQKDGLRPSEVAFRANSPDP